MNRIRMESYQDQVRTGSLLEEVQEQRSAIVLHNNPKQKTKSATKMQSYNRKALARTIPVSKTLTKVVSLRKKVKQMKSYET